MPRPKWEVHVATARAVTASSRRWTRVRISIGLSALILGLAACEGGVAPGGRPGLDRAHTSVLWVTICTLRADHLGTYGYPVDTSPVLDQLAERGVLFERTLASAPWTMPSMGAMVTGIYPHSLMLDPHTPQSYTLDERFRTAAEYFSEAGYATIGVVTNPNVNAVWGFDQGYDVYSDTGDKIFGAGLDKSTKVSAERAVERMLGHIRALPDGTRFFAHLVFLDLHRPLFPLVARARNPAFRLGRGPRNRYDEQIRYVDSVLGDFLAAIRRDVGEDVLLVVNADHGQGFMKGPGRSGHGRGLFNSTIWVPWILHHPALEEHAVRVSARVEGVDLLPTVLDLLEIPWDAREIEGRSLAGLIHSGKTVVARPFGVVETRYEGVNRSAILDDEWKLIVDWQGSGVEDGENDLSLYRYRADPGEVADQADARHQHATELLEGLEAWRRDHPGRLEDGLKARPVLRPEQEEELRALGYLGGDAAEEE